MKKNSDLIPVNLELDYLLNKMDLNLDLAGIFFVASWEHMEEGEKAFHKLKNKKENYDKLITKINKLRQSVDNVKQIKKTTSMLSNKLEKLITNLRKLEFYYEPVIRHFSLAKILLVASAEAYINEVAAIEIKGQSPQDEFDKLSIIGKWLFLPKLLKMKTIFYLDRDPLQSFSKLVRSRNKLIHFKFKPRKLVDYDIPPFIDGLSLSHKETEEAFKSVKNLISEFSLAWTDSYGPDWLNPNGKEYRKPCFYFLDRKTPVWIYSESVNEHNKRS